MKANVKDGIIYQTHNFISYCTSNIINCINKGNCSGGIVYYAMAKCNISNCYNIGECKNGIVQSLRKLTAGSELNIENCYNAGKTNNAILGEIKNSSDVITIVNTYYDKSKSTSVGARTEGITALNETDIKNNSTFISTLNNNIGENTDWKKWKIGEDGWPTFE